MFVKDRRTSLEDMDIPLLAKLLRILGERSLSISSVLGL
jgi:hypothetical protein